MHKNITILLAIATVALVAVAGGNAAQSKERFDLKGEVYANFKIEMKNSANARLTTVNAGVHTIKVEDQSSIHNFHLVGPGINKSTSVAGTGERVWTVKLRPGKYTFFCDPHAGQMRGSFRVTA
jgi:plastocyanin